MILFDELQAQAAALRERLRLRALHAKERRACLGKWFTGALSFCEMAARCQERHAADLGNMAPDAGAIREQVARVVALELCTGQQERLLKDLKDTLLYERARLYRMAAGVLDGLLWLGARPGEEAERDRYATSIAKLREPFERRNQKVKQGKREQAALRAAFAERAAPLVARCEEAAREQGDLCQLAPLPAAPALLALVVEGRALGGRRDGS